MSDYTVSPYRYRKGHVTVRCPSPNGFKTRASRLASTFGRYVNRAGGYVMSKRRADGFERYYAEGWDACTVTGDRIEPVALVRREIVPASWKYLVRDPGGHVWFPCRSRRAALELCRENGWEPKEEGNETTDSS